MTMDHPSSPFDLLSLPMTYEVNPAHLQASYLHAAAQWHPDRFTDPLDKREAELMSARINEARRVLSSDEDRADLLVRLLGGPDKSSEKSLPDRFLMEILEVRQELEEAVSTGDEAGRDRLGKWANEQRQAYRGRVAQLFSEILGSPAPDRVKSTPDPEILRSIRLELNAWRYIERMIEQMNDAHLDEPAGH